MLVGFSPQLMRRAGVVLDGPLMSLVQAVLWLGLPVHPGNFRVDVVTAVGPGGDSPQGAELSSMLQRHLVSEQRLRLRPRCGHSVTQSLWGVRVGEGWSLGRRWS